MHFEAIKTKQERKFLSNNIIKAFEERKEVDLRDSFLETLNIAQSIKDKGGQTFLVGGSVRDLFFNKLPKDFDLEVYRLSGNEIKETLKDYKISEVGSNFGGLKLFLDNGLDIDVSLPRKDNKTGQGHKGFSIETNPNLSFEDALKRRDFTINAMLLDPLTGEIIDPYRGKEDIENRILRVVDANTFKEDPLRVLRGVQFLGRLGLKIEDETLKIFKEMIPNLKELPSERIGEEWKKLLLRAEKPSLGLSLAMNLGVFHEIYPNFIKSDQAKQNTEGDAWINTLTTVDETAKVCRECNLNEEKSLTLLFSALCHNLEKSSASTFIKDIGLKDETKKKILKLVEHHTLPSSWYRAKTIKDGSFRKLAKNIYPANMMELGLLAQAYENGSIKNYEKIKGRDVFNWFTKKATDLNIIKSIPENIITGKDLLKLGIKPSPLYGEIIKVSNNLRDEKGFNREMILNVIRANPENTLTALNKAKS